MKNKKCSKPPTRSIYSCAIFQNYVRVPASIVHQDSPNHIKLSTLKEKTYFPLTFQLIYRNYIHFYCLSICIWIYPHILSIDSPRSFLFPSAVKLQLVPRDFQLDPPNSSAAHSKAFKAQPGLAATRHQFPPFWGDEN